MAGRSVTWHRARDHSASYKVDEEELRLKLLCRSDIEADLSINAAGQIFCSGINIEYLRHLA